MRAARPRRWRWLRRPSRRLATAAAAALLVVLGFLAYERIAAMRVQSHDRDHLHLTRSPEEIAAFRAIKAALDPSGTLAPNALLPPVVAPGGGGVSPPTARGGAAPRPAPPGDRS